MASSNRHWPRMFRSNPAACDSFHHQPADMNNSSGGGSFSFLGAAGRSPSLLSSGIEEMSGRSPDPKPRWNPKPEQIRILEGIFNSGVVNPPRDEIRRIRVQLQEYGQVGDANVFYWFQNRKSRTKNKLRAMAGGHTHPGRSAMARAPPRRAASPVSTPPRHLLAPTSSSSSSSELSSGSSSKSVILPATATAVMLPLPSTDMNLLTPTPLMSSSCQLYPMPTTRTLLAFPEPPPLLPQWPAPPQTHYLPATELGGVLSSHPQQTVSPSSTGMLLSLYNDALGQQDITDVGDTYMTTPISKQYVLDAMATSSSISDAVSTAIREDETARLGHGSCFNFTAATTTADCSCSITTAAVVDEYSPSPAPIIDAASSALTDQLQGLLDAVEPATATVVVLPLQAVRAAAADDDVAMAPAVSAGAAAQWYSVPAMTHLDVKLFGEAAVLLRHNGDQVPVDHSGVTVEPLQQGAVYYVLVAN